MVRPRWFPAIRAYAFTKLCNEFVSPLTVSTLGCESPVRHATLSLSEEASFQVNEYLPSAWSRTLAIVDAIAKAQADADVSQQILNGPGTNIFKDLVDIKVATDGSAQRPIPIKDLGVFRSERE